MSVLLPRKYWAVAVNDLSRRIDYLNTIVKTILKKFSLVVPNISKPS